MTNYMPFGKWMMLGIHIFDYSGNNFDAHFCCLSSMTRSIEIVQTGVPWLSMFGGGSGTLSPDIQGHFI